MPGVQFTQNDDDTGHTSLVQGLAITFKQTVGGLPVPNVGLPAGVPCPNCATELRASDVVVDRASGSAVLICSGCHRDTLVIDRTPGS